jgi:hypothetical protein
MATSIFDIPRATVGDRVQHEFLVVDREEKKQANGDPFVLFTLGNSSGRLGTAPLWSISSSGQAGPSAAGCAGHWRSPRSTAGDKCGSRHLCAFFPTIR